MGIAIVSAKKPKPGGGNAGKTTVKIKTDLHRDVRTVASYLDMELHDYLDSVLRPIVAKALSDMARKIQGKE